MGRAIRIWRALTWILGGLFVLPSAVIFWTQITDSVPRSHYASIALMGLYFLASVLGPVVAVGMKRRSRWARPAGWIAASLHTLAIPFFTPLGIFGLILLSRGAGRGSAWPISAPPSRRTATAALTMINIIGTFLAVYGFFRWAKRL